MLIEDTRETPNNALNNLTVRSRTAGNDVSLHHQKFAGAAISLGSSVIKVRNGHVKNCS